MCFLTLWAPLLKQAAVHLVAPEDRLIPMTRDEQGYWYATATGIEAGALYFYQWDGEKRSPRSGIALPTARRPRTFPGGRSALPGPMPPGNHRRCRSG